MRGLLTAEGVETIGDIASSDPGFQVPVDGGPADMVRTAYELSLEWPLVRVSPS
jgi:hypothetical protein